MRTVAKMQRELNQSGSLLTSSYNGKDAKVTKIEATHGTYGKRFVRPKSVPEGDISHCTFDIDRLPVSCWDSISLAHHYRMAQRSLHAITRHDQ